MEVSRESRRRDLGPAMLITTDEVLTEFLAAMSRGRLNCKSIQVVIRDSIIGESQNTRRICRTFKVARPEAVVS